MKKLFKKLIKEVDLKYAGSCISFGIWMVFGIALLNMGTNLLPTDGIIPWVIFKVLGVCFFAIAISHIPKK